ncbi:MAG: TonB family protein [Thiobacillaceae bacterium]
MHIYGMPPQGRRGPEGLVARLRAFGQATGEFLALAVSNMTNAVLVSAILHVVVIFSMTPLGVNPRLFEPPFKPLDVILVNARTETRPLNPEALAQVNLDGGGTVEAARQASSPLPASPEDSIAATEAEARVKALEQQAQALIDRLKSDYAVAEARPEHEPKTQPPTPTSTPQDLAARSLEMARLAARIDQQWDAYQKRPRRMFVGARAVEFTFARYVEDWRLKVERIGNLNYPEAARRNKLYGSLVLTVSINADGTVESVQIDRSSGSRILDAAAVKIVEMAAPFAPFPEEMRAKVDILGITRTWTFTRSDQLISQ